MIQIRLLSSTTEATEAVVVNDSSLVVADEAAPADSLTTDELLSSIEYNTRMASQGIGHLFTLAIFLLGAMGVWIILKKWYFGGV